jgi:hypothetical protein
MAQDPGRRQGLEVAVDDAGKAVLNTDRATARAVSSMVSGMGRVRDAADGVQRACAALSKHRAALPMQPVKWEQGGPRNFVEERNAG